MKRILLPMMMIAMLSLAFGCSDEGDSPTGPNGNGDTMTDTTGDTIIDTTGNGDTLVDYVTEVKPIFDNNSCTVSGCHGTGAGGLTWSQTDRASVLTVTSNGSAIVVPGDASSSKLYLRVTSAFSGFNRMPRSSDTLTTIQQELIRDWIDQGAN